MKLRIKQQLIRFRLTRTDVVRLAEDGVLEEHSRFTTCTLVYSIVRTDEERLSINFDGQKITLAIPGPMIYELLTSETVGFSENSGLMQLLVEKDFMCLENSSEDQSDNYAHPIS